MPCYLVQVGYNSAGWLALLRHPQDRITAVRPAITKLGGKIIGFWMAFGQHDVVGIIEMPSNVNAAAISMAFAAGGAVRSSIMTPLLTMEEGIEAMRQAGQAGYRPATSNSH